MLSSFRDQICLLIMSSVEFLCFVWRNDAVRFLYLVLTAFSVIIKIPWRVSDHETGLSGWKCSFFPTSNIYITLYFNVSSTLLRKNRNTDFLSAKKLPDECGPYNTRNSSVAIKRWLLVKPELLWSYKYIYIYIYIVCTKENRLHMLIWILYWPYAFRLTPSSGV